MSYSDGAASAANVNQCIEAYESLSRHVTAPVLNPYALPNGCGDQASSQAWGIRGQ